MASIYFASNRDVLREAAADGALFGNRFNADGPQFFRVGRVEVALRPGGRATDDDAWTVGRARLHAERREGPAALGSARMFEALRRALRGGERDLLIYIHGFAASFRRSAVRAAQLARLYGTPGREPVCVFFSWPANGVVFPSANYFSDREDAEMSGLAMARALQRLLEFLEALRRDDRATLLAARAAGDPSRLASLRECRRGIHLVAHSMGNWALGHAVGRLGPLAGCRRLPRLFDNAFLMAADADADALAAPHRLGPLVELASLVHVYHAANDLALQLSDRTKGNPDRLGADGPAGLDRLDPRVLAIDCRAVSDTALAHGRHQYYRLRPEVIADVRMSLAGVAPDDPGRRRIAVRPGRSWRLPAA